MRQVQPATLARFRAGPGTGDVHCRDDDVETSHRSRADVERVLETTPRLRPGGDAGVVAAVPPGEYGVHVGADGHRRAGARCRGGGGHDRTALAGIGGGAVPVVRRSQ